ncbi:MAG TPA: hypothetical protein ENN22_09345 [bacterium]|nr:hypothetical protein [bacterium]
MYQKICRVGCSVVLLILFSGIFSMGKGQYWGERVLEKSFEQMDFFFSPNYLNPYGLGNFAKSTPGLIADPFLDLIINPAHIYDDSTSPLYFYTDFRSIHTVEEQNYGIMPLDIAYSRADYLSYYPFYYREQRRELMPIFSGGLMWQPFKINGRSLFLGATYQAIFQNEDYYRVPFDIYRSAIGYDYAGNRTAESGDFPIVDRYSGDDRMHQIGHFTSVFLGHEILKNIRLGVKINRTIFDRDGDFGSRNFWESSYRYDYSSLWMRLESREQNYDHWDFGAGLRFDLSPQLAVGLSAGYLWGDAAQLLTDQDSSFYAYGQIDQSDDWSHYFKSGDAEKFWDHSGKNYYGGIDLKYCIDEGKTMLFVYQRQDQQTDILVRSDLSDTSYSNYHHQWDSYSYSGQYQSAVSDVRKGSGIGSTKKHRFMGSFQWQIESNKKLNIGVNLETLKRKIHTSEDVLAHRHYETFNTSSNDETTDYRFFETITEDKTLNWDFSTNVTTVQIPIIFQWQASKSVELLFGLNRKMANWKIEDETLAYFRYRKVDNSQKTELKQNFGERYREPKETTSDVKTTMIAGITFSPSEQFQLRLLVTPNFRDRYQGTELSDLQWWIGLNLFPR